MCWIRFFWLSICPFQSITVFVLNGIKWLLFIVLSLLQVADDKILGYALVKHTTCALFVIAAR